MKVFITMLILLFSVLFAYASTETLVKFYMNDGSAAEVIRINDISKMEIKKLSNNFSMTVYYKKDSSTAYQTSEIDTLKFVNNVNNLKQLNIYLSGSTKSYLVSDIDSIIFKEMFETVTIGTQVWTKKNLDVTHYRNGDSIPQVTDPDEWANLTTGAWCYYDNDESNNATYGKLYNWYAVNDSRGLAPSSYHVPSDEEWTTLETYLSNNSQYWCNNNSSYIAKSLSSKELWYTSDNTCCIGNNLNANNTSGFSGLPGGYRFSIGYYTPIRYDGGWWTSKEYDDTNAWYRRLINSFTYLLRNYDNKVDGFSVRCVKDEEQVIETVAIGSQVWTKKNLDVEKYRDGTAIRYAESDADWVDAGNKKEGAWCYYNNDPANGAIYGKLYNWYAVNDARGLAPSGYHVPSDAEWTTLSSYLGGESVAGGKMKEKGTAPL